LLILVFICVMELLIHVSEFVMEPVPSSTGHAFSSVDLLFYPENGGSRFLRNVGNVLRNCMTSHRTRCPLFKSRPSFFLVPPGKFLSNTLNNLPPFPSKPFPIHQSFHHSTLYTLYIKSVMKQSTHARKYVSSRPPKNNNFHSHFCENLKCR
jgi:hypothetical protein